LPSNSDWNRRQLEKWQKLGADTSRKYLSTAITAPQTFFDLLGGQSAGRAAIASKITGGRREKMTKSNKFLITGAAIAGLLAGTGVSVQASNLLTGAKASATAQDTEKKSDTKVKEKHACKGQNSCKGKGGCKSSDNGCKAKNSCKGKGGCATDGSKMPAEEKKPS
jgi:hypothetical protein